MGEWSNLQELVAGVKADAYKEGYNKALNDILKILIKMQKTPGASAFENSEELENFIKHQKGTK